MARANRSMVREYAQDLRLFPTWPKRIFLVVLLAVYLLVPAFLQDNLWSNVLALAGIFAIGAISLNLLTGYTGQPSLGHAAFIGLGAFIAGYLGGGRLLDTPAHGYFLNAPLPFGLTLPALWVYLFVALVIGGVVGFVMGLPALRLRGNYLVIVTLGMVYLALYFWQKWTTFTGGNAGGTMPFKAVVYDFGGGHQLDLLGHFSAFGQQLGPRLDGDRYSGLMYLSWGLVIVVAFLVKNIVRSRPGRALQAVRDRDVAAEVVGVSLFRYKIGAFVISSALASLCGALYGLYIGHLTPDETSLGITLSITFLAIIVVGGIGTMYGPIMGAILIGALPQLIDKYATTLPLISSIVTTDPAKGSGISKGDLSVIIYALLIIVFLVFEPRGLAGLWRRVQAYFRSWPFSY
jgi:branched-chain amino acid transport system permease protein